MSSHHHFPHNSTSILITFQPYLLYSIFHSNEYREMSDIVKPQSYFHIQSKLRDWAYNKI